MQYITRLIHFCSNNNRYRFVLMSCTRPYNEKNDVNSTRLESRDQSLTRAQTSSTGINNSVPTYFDGTNSDSVRIMQLTIYALNPVTK